MDPLLPGYVRLAAAESEVEQPAYPSAMDHLVTSCLDDGTAGTLRSVIEAATTQSGDSINLTMLPMMCSRITLSGTAISITQNELHIHGPGADQLTIDGNHESAVFHHSGGGTLGITGVTVANGYYLSTSVQPWGGCVHSDGSILMLNAVVSGCVLKNLSNIQTQGAGIYAHGYVTLFNSAVTDNRLVVSGANARGFGGGVFARGDFTALYSTLSGNVAAGSNGAKTGGGAVFAGGSADIEGTTVSGNRSQSFFGGIEVYGAPPAAVKILNSTISSNLTRETGGGIFSNIPLTLANSTVAFNTYTGSTQHAAGVSASSTLELTSSIIAANAGTQGPSDLGGVNSSQFSASSDHNLITSSSIGVPAGTLSACPKLDPLADNGGSTLTHKLRQTSPAIDQGDPGTQLYDQRAVSRVVGNQADIGAVEWQPSDIDERLLANGFDGVCDR